MIDLIALSGPAGSGKSTAATYLVECHGFTLVKFAAPLKNMLRAIGLTEREIEGDLKDVPSDKLCGRTPRYVMQTLGSSWGRDYISENFWVKLWEQSARDHERVVCDDVRFENEAAMIRECGGWIVGLTGRGGIEGNHISENGVVPDLSILNNGTFAELEKEIERIYRKKSESN